MTLTKAFEWTNKSKMAFQQVKKYLGSPPLLTILNMGEELTLCLSMSPTTMNVVMIKEDDKVQRPMSTKSFSEKKTDI